MWAALENNILDVPNKIVFLFKAAAAVRKIAGLLMESIIFTMDFISRIH